MGIYDLIPIFYLFGNSEKKNAIQINSKKFDEQN